MIQVVRRSIVDVYNQYNFTRQSLAYDSKGRLYHLHNARFEPGKFGQAVMVEEGTTNLLSNPSFESGLSPWDGRSSAILEIVTSEKYHGTNALKVSTSSDSSDAEASAQGVRQFVTVLPNTTYTFSVYVKGSGNIRIYIYDAANTTSANAYVTLSDIWQRIQVKSTTSSSCSLIHVGVVTNGAQTITFYVDAAQLEQKPYPTSFTPGTRAPEVLTIPTAEVLTDSGPWTVEFFGKVNFYFNQTLVLFSAWPKFYVAIGRSSRALLSWKDGTQRTVYSSLSIPDITGWHYWALSWDGTVAKVYVDAVKLIEVTTNLPSSLPSIARIGGFSSHSVYSNLIGDLRISNRARTDEEIAAAYNSNAPLPVDADTTYKLNFDGPDAQRAAKVLIV